MKLRRTGWKTLDSALIPKKALRISRPSSRLDDHKSSYHTLVTAITYTHNGDPTEVLKLKQFQLGPPEDNQVGLKFRLSSLNPADINTIQGRYPWRPEIRRNLIDHEEFYIAGNEGLAQITSLGRGVDSNSWKLGDWVIMGKPQLGTWRSHANLAVQDVIQLPRSSNLTEIQAATMAVNMSTAYRLIKDYTPPSTQDLWIIQNGANSSVGQYVLQLCKAWNLGCVGLIRDRPHVEELKCYLNNLGCPNKTVILTYEELAVDRSQTKSLPISLGFNCISGNLETSEMMKCMSRGSRLITYGGMSMKPLVVPTSQLIFRDLKLEGFMLTNWLMQASMQDRKKMLKELVALVDHHQLREHGHSTIVTVDSSKHAELEVRRTVKESMSGLSGKKFLFRFAA